MQSVQTLSTPPELQNMLNDAIANENKHREAYYTLCRERNRHLAEVRRCYRYFSETTHQELKDDWEWQAERSRNLAEGLKQSINRVHTQFVDACNETKRIREAIQIWRESQENI